MKKYLTFQRVRQIIDDINIMIWVGTVTGTCRYVPTERRAVRVTCFWWSDARTLGASAIRSPLWRRRVAGGRKSARYKREKIRS